MRNIKPNSTRDAIAKAYAETDWDAWRRKTARAVTAIELLARFVSDRQMDPNAFEKHALPLLATLGVLEVELDALVNNMDVFEDIGTGGGA